MSVGRMAVIVAFATGVLMLHSPLDAQRNTTPLTAARFGISIDGVEIASFTRFDSLVDASSAGAPPSISLRGGQQHSPELWAWHEAVLLGDIVAARKSCSIVFYGHDGAPIRTYNLKQAWPAKYTAGTRANGRLKTEAIVIVHEGFDIH